ncbi:MAG: hypothetical protein VX438_07500 [Planctomycetota bacterium]|nr:hypothetical protein [Planctomycetota bacterium]
MRERARLNLVKAGEGAYRQLYRAKNIKDLDARFTIGEILSLIKVQWTTKDDSPAVVDLMSDFQKAELNQRLATIDHLFWLSVDESWPAIYRIMIFDRAKLVSDHAATRLLEMIFLRDKGPDSALIVAHQEMFSKRFQSLDPLLSSKANWGEKVVALCFARASASQKLWMPSVDSSRLIELQENSIRKIPDGDLEKMKFIESRLRANRIIYQLLSPDQQELCSRLDRVGLTLVKDSMRSKNVSLLLATLQKNQRWTAIVNLFEQQKSVVQRTPALGFLFAEGFRLGGKTERAVQIFQNSLLEISNEQKGFEVLIDELLELGLSHWVSNLIRDRIGTKKVSIKAGTILARLELQQRHVDESARIAEWMLKLSDPVESRTLLVLADVAKARGNPVEEMRWLQAALKQEPLSPLILGRIYWLSKSLENFDSDKLQEQINIALGAYRDKFREGHLLRQSDLPAEQTLGKVKMGDAGNSLAWLLSNLERDLPQALARARFIVKLERNNPVFLSTLAFCEFKNNNRKLAIELQRRAVFAAPQQLELQFQLKNYLR